MSGGPDAVRGLLDPLPVRKLFGLGPRTVPRVEALGIQTLGELSRASIAQLRPVFGRYAERIQQRAAGIDDRPVLPDVDEKQISAEETFATDLTDPVRLRREIVRLADKACSRLRAREMTAACVVIKIRRGDFTTYTRQRHIEPPTQETRVVTSVALDLLDAWVTAQPRSAVRLLGVGVSDLTTAAQLSLFATPEAVRTQRLDATVDDVRDRFGAAALRPASSLGHAGSATQSTLGARIDHERPGSQQARRDTLESSGQREPESSKRDPPGAGK